MPPPPPNRARQIVAWIVVAVTVLAVWKYLDYRNQPPPGPVIPWVIWVG